MSTLSDLAEQIDAGLSEADIDWLHLLTADWQLLADLAFADIVLWIPGRDGQFIAVAQARPSGAPTLFDRDFIGKPINTQWQEMVDEAVNAEQISKLYVGHDEDGHELQLQAVPVMLRVEANDTQRRSKPIAVLTQHSNLTSMRWFSRREETFRACAADLFEMIVQAEFPDLSAPTGPKRGAPRVSDGLIRLDDDGLVQYASPNAVSTFTRMGFHDELEGRVLAEVTTELLTGKLIVDESLPLVVTGRAPWRTEIEVGGIATALRAIPLKQDGERIGAIILSRDVTELRHQERELITKDATIREIHHRVKNNLQTVASLLRIQARRTHSEDARESLNQAITRVGAIAVVHDTLSEGLSQNVDFDVVFERVIMLVTEVASTHNTEVRPTVTGSFGVLPSQYATPLALALTELVTNAVEHGLAGRKGMVEIIAERNYEQLKVVVRDNGVGLPEGKVGSGLGTQIVRTLIQGELSGSIDWHTLEGEGTEVTIEVPLRWLKKGK